MAISASLQGMPLVLRNLNTFQANTRRKIGAGLYRAAVLLMYQSQKLVPIQFGFLRASKFIRSQSQGAGGKNDQIPSVYLGYTSEYAIYVHENLENAHGAAFNRKHMMRILGATKSKKQVGSRTKNTVKSGLFFRGEMQQAKFLESPMRTMRKEMLEEVARTAKISPEDLA